MYNILVKKTNPNAANISQITAKRDWMEATVDRHAYNCFPVTLTNTMSWGLSFPEDISFIWDGISDTSPDHVRILSGEKYCSLGRANATISFNTGLIFKTDENISLMQMPVPNMFIRGAQAFTTLMSTSFFTGEFPCAWRITEPNRIITIKANQPFISIVPISLTELQGSSIAYTTENFMPNIKYTENQHLNAVREKTESGQWTNFYRDAVDPLGNKIGSHEVKSIRLKVIDYDK